MLHVCINGLGERTGNASLEEVAVVMQVLYGIDLGIKMDGLVELSRLTERLGGIKLPRNKPIVGEACFTRETGLFMDVLRETPLAIFPLHAHVLGREFEIVLGKKSGKASIGVKLDEAGLEATDEQIQEILAEVKSRAISRKELISDSEFREIVEEFVN